MPVDQSHSNRRKDTDGRTYNEEVNEHWNKQWMWGKDGNCEDSAETDDKNNIESDTDEVK